MTAAVGRLLPPAAVDEQVCVCPVCQCLQTPPETGPARCPLCGVGLADDLWAHLHDPAATCEFLQCDRPVAVCFIGTNGDVVEWCRACFERPCGRCKSEFTTDRNRTKGLCQDCRDEIASWSGSDADGPADDHTQVEIGGWGQ